ncbi:MAG: hypothetical protein ABI688_01450 [Bacteroidota bacterium]
MDAPTSPVIYTGRTDNFFRKRYNATIIFLGGLLLFFLPFAQFNCASVTIAENTGLGLATGAEWKVSSAGGMNSLLKELNKVKGNSTREKIKVPPDWFLLLGIVFAISGIIFSVSTLKIKHVASMSAGILAAVMLVASLIHLKMLIKSQIPLPNNNDSLGLNYGHLLQVKFTTWFYLSMGSFITAAFLGYKHHRIEMNDAMDREIYFEFQTEQQDE